MTCMELPTDLHALIELGRAVVKALEAQLIMCAGEPVVASSASKSASTSKRKREGGKRSRAARKATRSRRVMPAVSAIQSKPLRKKSVEATK